MRLVPVTCSLMLALVSATAHARVDHRPLLDFERTERDSVATSANPLPGGPQSTLFRDSVVVHTGRFSCRIERNERSAGQFSSVTFGEPVDFRGTTLELRGWLKLDNVVGWTGLWLREDGPSGVMQFDNMQSRGINGTADWAEFRVVLPLDAKTRSLAFGALLSGTGRVWVDQLQLFVDGNPIADAPEKPRVLTVLDRDTSFTAASGIALDRPSKAQIGNLVLLGKVWGFLKYHHPAVVRGDRQWDFDLFRVAPGVLAAKDAAGAQRAISSWIDSLGPVNPGLAPVELPPGRVLAPRLGWLTDRARLGQRLSDQLVRIHKSRPDVKEQFFVSHYPGVGNPDFATELGYERQREPDAGYRLLALYRFWNMVEYWFPYRDLIDGDWDACLREFVPRMLGATSRDAYLRETMALIARVSDTHANLWSAIDQQPPVGKAALPVSVRFVERQAVVVDYTNPRLGPASGLELGDVITAIDGVRVSTLVERWRPMFAVSNDAARLRDMARGLTRGGPGMARLSVRRGNETLELQAQRVPRDSLDNSREWVHDHAGATVRRLSPDLAYLKMSSVQRKDVASYLEAIRGAKCVVIDIRNYPSDFLVFELGQHLVKGETPFVKFSVGDLSNPGSFAFGEPLSLKPQEPYLEGAVAILVDEVTQSSAEYTTMAFRSRPGTLVVGSQTAGADGNVSRIALPGGERTMFSGIGVFYPDGRPTQRIGIVPDLEVRPTIAGMRAGRDEVLEAAVRRVLGRGITAAELAALAGTATKPSP